MYYSFFILIALVLEGLGQMDCAGVAGVIPGLKGASATCNLQPGNQLNCLLQIPEPRKSTGLMGHSGDFGNERHLVTSVY